MSVADPSHAAMVLAKVDDCVATSSAKLARTLTVRRRGRSSVSRADAAVCFCGDVNKLLADSLTVLLARRAV